MIVRTSAGTIQFGAPPETIKDTIGSGEGVAPIFVLTRSFFAYDRGISFAELEFPILRTMNSAQRTLFQSFMVRGEHAAGDVLCRAGSSDAEAFLVATGELEEVAAGALVAGFDAITDEWPQPTTVKACVDSSVYRLQPAQLRDFLLRYPGLYLQPLHADEVRTA
jgi:hypothetical protein